MSSRHRKGGADVFGEIDEAQLPAVPIDESSMVLYGDRQPERHGATIPPLRVTKVGLQGVPATFEEWEAFGRTLKDIESGLQFAIGDWLRHGERRWGDRYKGAAEALGFEVATLWDYKYVAENVEISVRTEILKFGHHKLVAALDPKNQKHWLTLAAIGADGKPWSLARMRDEMGDPDGSRRQTFDWYSNWFARRIDMIYAKARKATDAEKRLVAADLRRMADELEGKS